MTFIELLDKHPMAAVIELGVEQDELDDVLLDVNVEPQPGLRLVRR